MVVAMSKHLIAEAGQRQQVQHVDVPPAAFDRQAFQTNAFQLARLYVTLEGPATQALGPQMHVLALAAKVLSF
jgi:hypothetical protein